MSTSTLGITGALPGVTVDLVDLARFAPLARSLASRRGWLIPVHHGVSSTVTTSPDTPEPTNSSATTSDSSSDGRQFFCLYGNLLYALDGDTPAAANTPRHIYFLEACTARILEVTPPIISIATVGGQSLSFRAVQGGTGRGGNMVLRDLREWVTAMEEAKVKTLIRRTTDAEAELAGLRFRAEQEEVVALQYETSLASLKAESDEQKSTIAELQERLATAEREKNEATASIREAEKERLTLLASRGVIPRPMPTWAVHEMPRKGVNALPRVLKIWTGTWNLSGATQPFGGQGKHQKAHAPRLLQPFVPTGYDIYVLALQESHDSSVEDAFNTLLDAEGCRRLKSEAPIMVAGTHGNSAASGKSALGGGNDATRVVGKGNDNSSNRATTLAIWVRSEYFSDVHPLAITSVPLANSHCRGAVAMVLSVYGRTLLLINSHLDARDHSLRREQFTNLCGVLGTNLAESGWSIGEQFHHIIWVGDLGSCLVDPKVRSSSIAGGGSSGGDGDLLTSQQVVKRLEDSSSVMTLFDQCDQLNRDRREAIVFSGYREASPFPNFLPTTRKIVNRPPVNYSSSDWQLKTYVLSTKTAWGGGRKDRPPRFSDRVLYSSMADVAEDLIPEPVETEFLPTGGSNAFGLPAASTMNSIDGYANRTSLWEPTSPVGGHVAQSTRGMSVRVHNYRTVNDGDGLNLSQHSPVFCTFLLRLRHDHERTISNLRLPPSAPGTQLTTTGSGSNTTTVNSASNHTGSTSGEFSESRSPSVAGTPLNNTAEDIFSTMNRRRSRMSRDVTTGGFTSPLRSPSGRANSTFLPSPRQVSIAGFNDSFISNSNSSAAERMSLLPHGLHRIRLSQLRLVYGGQEVTPMRASVLFPAPYEAVVGERFAGFESESTALMNYLCSAALASSSGTSVDMRGSMRLSMRSPTKETAPQSVEWRRTGVSRTGTCLSLSVDRLGVDYSSMVRPELVEIPSLTLTWRGDEPLDRLHISLRVGMLAQPINVNGSTQSHKQLAESDLITGSCALSLEQLCKVALANPEGGLVTLTVARPLQCRGRPMHAIDGRTLQRELVTLTCQMELLGPEDQDL